jgi:hypothetical protein
VNQTEAAALRKPFDEASVGKLPRVWCKACRDSQSKNCGQHPKIRCEVCGNTITKAHLHLDYVGHAEITDRLLSVDPDWTWEPFAIDANGLPAMGHGGLWIRLTVLGVTRIGFGSADGKTGPDAMKEAIGDALRNAAMRFGVGLDLWGAKFKGGEDGHHDDVDPVEETVLFDALVDELAKAKTPADIKAVGRSAKAGLSNKELTQARYDRLDILAGERLAEITPVKS